MPWQLHLDTDGPYRVVDLHVDTPYQVHFKKRKPSSPSKQASVSMLLQGHYAGIVYPIYVPDYAENNNPSIALVESIESTLLKIVEHQPKLALVAARPSASQVAVFKAIEGAGAFAADIRRIDAFIERGVRLIGPVHANDNRLAGSATGKERHGLTKLGKAFCRRVYQKGALIDVSHMSDRAFADLVPIAKKAGAPLVATHSNARARCKHPRNLSDRQLAQIRASKGVVGLNLHSRFLRRGTVELKHVVAMVHHLLKVLGNEGVAIGTDFDGGRPPTSLRDASRMQVLARALLKSGLSDGGLRAIFGRNALRMLNWKPVGGTSADAPAPEAQVSKPQAANPK